MSPSDASREPGSTSTAAEFRAGPIKSSVVQEYQEALLDVHAPYEALQTWKGFFVHIATICIGLLIAIALEQSVETIHRHRELAAVRDDLRAESRQILTDSRQSQVASLYEEHWLTVRIAQAQAAIRDGRSLAPSEHNNGPYSATPDIPIWRSAKAGARTPLLTKGEVNAYSEVEYVQAHVEVFYNVEQATESDLRSFNRMFTVLPNGDTDFTGASSQDPHAYVHRGSLGRVIEPRNEYGSEADTAGAQASPRAAPTEANQSWGYRTCTTGGIHLCQKPNMRYLKR
jgi:hypothetical protein